MSAASHIADGPLGRLSVSGHVWSTRIPRALLVQHADWTDSRGPLTFQENSAVAFLVYLVGRPDGPSDLHHTTGRNFSYLHQS